MSPQDVDHRLTELEIKVSFAEDTLDRLNDIIIEQQRRIELMTRELVELRGRSTGDDGPVVRNLRDELPPHY